MSALAPMEFKEANRFFVGSGGVQPLTAFTDGECVVSCWGMTWRHRLNALLFGKVWLCVKGNFQPPVWVDVDKTIFIKGQN